MFPPLLFHNNDQQSMKQKHIPTAQLTLPTGTITNEAKQDLQIRLQAVATSKIMPEHVF